MRRGDSGYFRTPNGFTHVGEATMRDRTCTRASFTPPPPTRVMGIHQKNSSVKGDRRMTGLKGFGSHYGRDFQPRQADMFWRQRTQREAYYADRPSTGVRDFEAAPSVRYPESRGHKRDNMFTSYGDGLKVRVGLPPSVRLHSRCIATDAPCRMSVCVYVV